MKIHYEDEMRGFEQKFAACNAMVLSPLTAVPSKVTCKRCQKTQAYKEMVGE